MDKKSDLLGMEVLMVMNSGNERHGFVAYCDDSRGLTIKDIETQKDLFCHDIIEWDRCRKIHHVAGNPMLYRHNGAYVHEYLKNCIRLGFMWGEFVERDLRNHKAKNVCGTLAQCPSGL